MDKPMIKPPGERVGLHDLKAEIGTAPWFTVLSKSMGEAVKTAVDAGMSQGLAEDIYKAALSSAIDHAIVVRDSVTLKGWRTPGLESR
ncbi:hypothetical protein [Cohnella sp. GbtcB17]|uniref:hypothetical protein n=1 Tax=Cohnella sp. GbtcB17 TaxID=2824762 RepID=UPI001C2FC894|nr:hypothetical protein [Cohnella sp. GbtcB17]